MKNNKKLYIIFTILIIIFSSSIVIKELKNDTFTAIKIGDYILHNGIDFIEHFNIDNTLIWHNARWLFNVIVALIYNAFGFVGIHAFVFGLSSILGLTIFNLLKKQNNNLILSFILTIFTMESLGGYICARAQTISYLLFLIEIFSIDKLVSTNKKRYIFIILICSVLVANIHTTVWPMTLVFFLPYIAEYILSKIKLINKTDKLYYENINIKLLIITFIIISLSGLLTPLGLTPYTYMFKTMSGVSSEYIIELQPTNILTNYAFLAYIVIYIILLVYLRIKIKISDLFMLLGLFVMGTISVRNNAFLYIASPFILSRLFIIWTKPYEDKIEKVVNYFKTDKLVSMILLIPIIFLTTINFVACNRGNYINESIYPVKAADYILDNINTDEMRLLNDFNNGAYLEFRGIKVFIDSRSEIYCKEFNNTNALEEYGNMKIGRINYNVLIDKYKITHILLEKIDPLCNYISYDEKYKKIYSDKYYVLYEKVK